MDLREYPEGERPIKSVYLAGPMRNLPLFNFPAFHEAAADLRDRGLTVWSPAEKDLEEGFDPASSEAKPLRYYMAVDLNAVCNSDAVIVLPGWESSQGARLEVHVAHECDIRVIAYPSMSPVHPSRGGKEEGRQIVVNPVTGGQKETRRARPELIPAGPLWEVSRLYGAGAAKYEDRNWERGFAWSLAYGALQRHLLRFWQGEDVDPENGCHHLAAAVFHALALMQFGVTHPELDDRPSA